MSGQDDPDLQTGVALRDAVERRDTVVVAALVTEGQLLTGLDPEFARAMRSTFEELVAPDLVEEQRAILDAHEALFVGIRSAQEGASESHSDILKKLDEAQSARRKADEALTAMDAS